MLTTSHLEDIPWNGEVSSKPTPFSEDKTETGYIFNDVTWKQNILSLGSFLPLNLIGRSQERLQVARALLLIEKTCQLRRVLSIQVDGIYIEPPKKDLKKIQKEFRSVRYCDLHTIQKPLLSPFEFRESVKQKQCKSQEFVYKCNQTKPRFPGGTLKIAHQGEHIDPPFHEELEWNVIEEKLKGPDDFVEKVLEHIRADKSFTCLGAPGTGKTLGILAKVKEDLLARSERVVCLAPTHAAARLLPEGDTIHHFVSKYVLQGSYQGWILIDEISMCVLPILAALDQLRLTGTKIATFGDWDQLEPVGNSWRGTPIDNLAFQNSRMYKLWSDCTLFRLRRCRRSDTAHFNFYTNLPQNLPKAISACKKRYAPDNDEAMHDADLHVTISHKRRRTIAHERQKSLAEGQACIEIPAYDDPAFRCFIGTKLVGNSTLNRIVNGGRYTVTAIGKEKITLLDDLTKDEFEASFEVVAKSCLLGHAMVYNKVQGSTEEGSVMLHDTSSKYFKKSHLYVGLSRVKDGKLVQIASD